jgi:Family of unknown function (DUF6544)
MGVPMLKIALMAGLVVALSCGAYVGWSWWSFARSISNDVAVLTTNARAATGTITSAMLKGLPEPVQRHLRQAGVLGRQIPRIVHLRQTGRIRGKADAKWMTFEAEQVYSINPPGFVWRAWLPSRRVPVVFGRDEYLGDQGSVVMKMLGTLPVAHEDGAELVKAGLMRYLNEMMWFPAAYLGDNIEWSAIDAHSAGIAISDRGMRVAATLYFDDQARLTNFSAPRFNTATGRQEVWQTPIADYGRLADMNLPAAGQAVWKLPDGDFAYIELKVLDVTYE